jgi:hypothetical protein
LGSIKAEADITSVEVAFPIGNNQMKTVEKPVSVSRVAEERREKDHESNRKATSSVKALDSRPSEHFTRADRHASVTSAGQQGPNAGDVIQSEPGIEQPETAGSGSALSVAAARAAKEADWETHRKSSSSV